MADQSLERRVLLRISGLPRSGNLERFSAEAVAPIANESIGTAGGNHISEAHGWLQRHGFQFDQEMALDKLHKRSALTPHQIGELVFLLHLFGSRDSITEISCDPDLYSSPGREFAGHVYGSQAMIAALGLWKNESLSNSRWRSELLSRLLILALRAFKRERKPAANEVITTLADILGKEVLKDEYGADPREIGLLTIDLVTRARKDEKRRRGKVLSSVFDGLEKSATLLQEESRKKGMLQ